MVTISETKTTSFDNKEGRKINCNMKIVQDDIEITDCEAYGVAPSALAISSRMDYEHVF